MAGSLQIYGCGTALFLVDDDEGQSVILRVHNCLYGQGQFNLLSVSQLCQGEHNSVDFNLDSPALLLSNGSKRRSIRVPLFLEDGLFAFSGAPFPLDDCRFSSLRKVDVTPGGIFRPSNDSSLHRWNSKVLVSANETGRFLVARDCDYDYNLQSYCGNFLAPPSIPLSRRQYNPAVAGDMSDLTTRFLGLGVDRLKRTIELSNGLATPASKSKIKVPDLKPFFPQGRWTEGKTPRVSKTKVGTFHNASIGEAVFTDTFESGDSKYRYGQAYFDLASHWGDVFPLRSRNEVGISFADFCSRNWIPLVLVRDNIGENIGGSLIEECRLRNVKSVYICPRHPQQNYAEGYLGRITAMASFAMVFAGAPLFMWVYAVRTAVFISNISASFYSKQGIWSTPYTLIHGESFPDSSIVVPFGCAVLVLRDSDDRAKFVNRAVLMVFVHYSEDHPLFTYAVYSPRTKRILHRQDVIFMTSVFPMRLARVASGLGPSGDALTLFRSPTSVLEGCPPDLSFGDWGVHDNLPTYDDDVSGFGESAPYGSYVEVPEDASGVPVHNPSHPSFAVSSVLVPVSAVPSINIDSSQPRLLRPVLLPHAVVESIPTDEPVRAVADTALPPRRSGRTKVPPPPPFLGGEHRPVQDRWFYEPVGIDQTSVLFTGPRVLEELDGDETHPDPDRSADPGVSEVSSTVTSPLPSQGSMVLQSGGHLGPSRPPTPWSLRLTSEGPTGRFAIRLLFPGGELGAQLFMVTTAMTVPTLARAVAQMMNVLAPVSMYVAPLWELLAHEGFIVDRVFPGTDTPCPFLEPGTIVRVFRDPTDNPGIQLVRSHGFSTPSASTVLIGREALPGDVFGRASRLSLAHLDNFPATSNLSFSDGRPLRNGEGGAAMTADEVALYDANTWERVRAIDSYNEISQARLGGFSPHELVYGSRESSSSVCIEELSDSSPDQGTVPNTHSGSDSPWESPPSKRSRSDERMGSESPESLCSDPLENLGVSRHERAILLKMFRKEQRLSRKRYKATIRSLWEAHRGRQRESTERR